MEADTLRIESARQFYAAYVEGCPVPTLFVFQGIAGLSLPHLIQSSLPKSPVAAMAQGNQTQASFSVKNALQMTSMLYIWCMQTKLNVPGEIEPGPSYSFRSDWRVNAWMYVAMAISILTDLVFRDEVRSWPDLLRTLAAGSPLLAILLWIRRLVRWIQGMDELDRSITKAACLFATAATFFFIIAWHHLSRMAVLNSLFTGRWQPYASMDLCVPWLVLWLLLISYVAGQRIFNRRFQ